MRFYRKAAAYFFLAWVTAWMVPYATPGRALAADPVEGIHYNEKAGTVTLRVQDMPLYEILQTVSAASGVKLSVQADINRPVTVNLAAVPLDQAIRRLVRPNSFAMVYSKKEDGSVVLSSVKIFDKGDAVLSPESPPPIRRPNVRGDVSAFGDASRSSGRFAGTPVGTPAGGLANNGPSGVIRGRRDR